MPTRPPVAPIASSWASVRLREAGAERVGAGVAGDQRPGFELARRPRSPASFRWLRSTRMPSSAQAATSARPRVGEARADVRARTGRRRGRRGRRRWRGSRPGRASAGPPRTRGRAPRGRGRSPRRPRGAGPRPAARPSPRPRRRRRSRARPRTSPSRSSAQQPPGGRGRRGRRRRPAGPAPASGSARSRRTPNGAPRSTSSPGEGVKTAKMPPRIPPARIRGRSRWPPSRPLASRRGPRWVRASLWPSKTGIMAGRRLAATARRGPGAVAGRSRVSTRATPGPGHREVRGRTTGTSRGRLSPLVRRGMEGTTPPQRRY